MVSETKVYSLLVNYDDFKSFIPKDLSASVRCKGKPLNWDKPLEIEIDEEDMGMPEADISMLNIGSLVISESLYNEAFRGFIEGCEFLPLEMGDRKFRLVNVINVVDCIDKNQSSFNEFGGVSDLVFDKTKLPTSGFFKIAEDNFSSIFCVDDVRELIQSHKISGVELEEFPTN